MTYLSTYLLLYDLLTYLPIYLPQIFLSGQNFGKSNMNLTTTPLSKKNSNFLSQFGDLKNLQKGEFVTKYSPLRKLCDLLATFWQNKIK